MKLNTSPRVGLKDPDLQRVLRDTANQVNALTEGRISAVYNADTAAPLAGEYVKGDFIRNSNPSEQNTGGLKYVVFGWECIVSGNPGTWAEVRYLTGNGLNITKLLSNTATLDFSSIGSNSTETLYITVTGSEVGDHVIIVPPSTLEDGLIYCSGVTSADTVCVRVHNTSGGSINPASATWRATVFKVE